MTLKEWHFHKCGSLREKLFIFMVESSSRINIYHITFRFFRILEIVFLLLPAFPLSLKGCQREMIKRSACPHQSLLPVCFVSRSHTLWFWFCDKEETTDTPFQTFRLPSIVFLTFNWRLFYKEITLKVYKAFCYSNFHSLAERLRHPDVWRLPFNEQPHRHFSIVIIS